MTEVFESLVVQTLILIYRLGHRNVEGRLNRMNTRQKLLRVLSSGPFRVSYCVLQSSTLFAPFDAKQAQAKQNMQTTPSTRGRHVRLIAFFLGCLELPLFRASHISSFLNTARHTRASSSVTTFANMHRCSRPGTASEKNKKRWKLMRQNRR
jgi:hypothetical protein